MLRVGFIGWRGMVGSVLLQRMSEEKDFAGIEPVFFSTSNAGGLRLRSRRAARNCSMPKISKRSRPATS